MSETPPSPDPAAVTIDEPTIGAAVDAALAAIASAGSTAELKQVRIDHVGDASVLSRANASIRDLPKDQKAFAGKLVGQSKGRVQQALAARQAELAEAEEEAALARETVDVTVPVNRRPRGARHPMRTLQDRIEDFFVGIGWEIAEGPEIETGWFNFDALNADPNHPSRSLQDTLYVAPEDSGLLLRTQTSPVQIRAMLERGAPLYIACPGTVYRADEFDATHSPMFNQVEGLAIDKDLTMANLVGTLDAFAAAIFGGRPITRLRPNHFPFTEPSAEMDFRCFSCEARLGLDHDADPACRVCGGTGWIEMGGCGMVHPNVLRSAGVDPEEYQGFAFGLGIERILMLRNGADMRDIVEGDVRFSQHYGTEI
ncbi:phenylalanine--tRNA ligase subunit alpha [Brachybacterium halotolerans subsp. kimchii]|uniref:phenylalanine--tRNA ligase subunit alpha n=1 Tax=Brachybacterium halotolerans TaxID=2795215 RepID=UPI001E2FE3DF|nr:phenylalanine--tRNA ligase subunit alpha [Brachybacterium halotolerans]UEJ82488.1 phenylalanine--tRNA ligase subunit alpha [Brachybacterium halotolerans subsp. kimchii]